MSTKRFPIAPRRNTPGSPPRVWPWFASVVLSVGLTTSPTVGANLLDYVESVRSGAAVVYVAQVEHVHTEPHERHSYLRAQARLEVVGVFRSQEETPPDTATISFSSYDEAHPPPVGGHFYQLTPGERVLIFADRFDASLGARISLMYRSAHRPLEDTATELRKQLIEMSDDEMELHRIDESDRVSQRELYDRILSFLEVSTNETSAHEVR